MAEPAMVVDPTATPPATTTATTAPAPPSTTTATPPPATTKPTLTAATDPDPKGPEPTTTFPEDWRTQMSGGDEKVEKLLARFTTPAAAAKALSDLRDKQASGAFRNALTPDATPEQLAQWRTENDVPEKPDGYQYDTPAGLVRTPDDEALLGELTKFAHAQNWPQNFVRQGVQFFDQLQEQQAQAQAEADARSKEEGILALREQWGREFAGNINGISSMLGDIGDYVYGARGPDGALLGNHPEFLGLMANLVRQLNPMATLLPHSSNPTQDLKAELEAFRVQMRNDDPAYFKNPAAQERYQRVVAALIQSGEQV